MTDPMPSPDRWDGWDDSDYKPTREELKEMILPPFPSGTTPEHVARALFNYRPAEPAH